MIPVVIAFTSNYLIPAATLVHSVLHSSAYSFEFICLSAELIPDRQKTMLDSLAEGRAKFRYFEAVSLPDGVYIDPRYSAAAEYRLLLPELLPEYDKVLYVDCDMIVRNDLGRLYEDTDLGDNLSAVVFERRGYFNSGFLLMNLALMRKERTSCLLLEALKTDYLEFPDQDALNKVMEDRVLALPPSCNGIRTFWLPQYKSEFLSIYTQEDYSDMLEHGNIHYTGGKPWDIFTVRFGDWWAEYSSLPEEIKKEWNPSSRIQLMAKIYLYKPGRLCMDSLQTFYRKIRYKV